jgi:hypothetical protein
MNVIETTKNVLLFGGWAVVIGILVGCIALGVSA